MKSPGQAGAPVSSVPSSATSFPQALSEYSLTEGHTESEEWSSFRQRSQEAEIFEQHVQKDSETVCYRR